MPHSVSVHQGRVARQNDAILPSEKLYESVHRAKNGCCVSRDTWLELTLEEIEIASPRQSLDKLVLP